MPLQFHTDNYAPFIQKNLRLAESTLKATVEQLSTGQRISNGGDDASGIAISISCVVS